MKYITFYFKSWIVSLTVNEMNIKTSTSWFKLEDASQKERIHIWKELFKYRLRKSPKNRDKPITKMINNQLDIKQGQCIQEKLDAVQTKMKKKKAAGFNKIPPDVWKTRKFDDLLLRYCDSVYKQNTIVRWTKGWILSYLQKCDLGIAKKYWSITVISIEAKILRKNQNRFRKKTDQQHHRFWQSIQF